MIIKQLLARLTEAKSPVVQVLQHQSAGKVLALGFKKGMILKEHQTVIPARLVVISGSVVYKQEDKSVTLSKFSDMEIPVKVMHSVEALEQSLCLLILG
jgi:hypothetical protein